MRITQFSALAAVVALASVGLGLSGCSTSASSTSGSTRMAKISQPSTAYPHAHKTLSRMVGKAPGIRKFLKNAYGYVVFPTVGEGAFIVGGAHGRGSAFRNNTKVANCTISKASVGWQAGGQTYSEVIFFKSKPQFDNFLSGNFAFDTGVKATAVKAGAAASVGYNDGVAVFSLPKGGLIASAAVGGQHFSCKMRNRHQ
jgi:lipid-binding SYLF domain-containing protein